MACPADSLPDPRPTP
uniref:Uncharacterized protein n=1 Tax=Arundo donax TaxID=35708 RepID=A0A0A9BU08_ARUDO